METLSVCVRLLSNLPPQDLNSMLRIGVGIDREIAKVDEELGIDRQQDEGFESGTGGLEAESGLAAKRQQAQHAFNAEVSAGRVEREGGWE